MLLNCGAGEDSWESFDFKEIQPVNPEGNHPWVFAGGIDITTEAPVLWLPDAKSQLTGKDPDAGKEWGQEEKGQRRLRQLFSIINSMNMSLSKLWKIMKDREAWGAAVHRVAKSWTWLSGWKTMVLLTFCCSFFWLFSFTGPMSVDFGYFLSCEMRVFDQLVP